MGMGGIGHVVSRIVTSSSSSTASYRSKISRVKYLKLIWLLTLLDQFQNQKDKFAFYFLLLLVVTATQGRRVAEWTRCFQLQSKLDRKGAFDFFGIPKRDFRTCTQSTKLRCSSTGLWALCPLAMLQCGDPPHAGHDGESQCQQQLSTKSNLPIRVSAFKVWEIHPKCECKLREPKIIRSQSGWYRGEWQPREDPTPKLRLVSDVEE